MKHIAGNALSLTDVRTLRSQLANLRPGHEATLVSIYYYTIEVYRQISRRRTGIDRPKHPYSCGFVVRKNNQLVFTSGTSAPGNTMTLPAIAAEMGGFIENLRLREDEFVCLLYLRAKRPPNETGIPRNLTPTPYYISFVQEWDDKWEVRSEVVTADHVLLAAEAPEVLTWYLQRQGYNPVAITHWIRLRNLS